MRGSEFIRRYIEATRANTARVGKRASRKQLDRLAAMRVRLEASRHHNTMEEALRELASLILSDRSERGRSPGGGQQQQQQHPQQQHPRASDDVALYTIHRSRVGKRHAR